MQLLVKGNNKNYNWRYFLFSWTSGLRGFITNLQVPARFICYALPCSPCCACLSLPPYFILSALLYIKAAVSVVPSSTVTNWHVEFSTGTFNPGDEAYKRSPFYSLPLEIMFITRWISSQKTSAHCLKSATRLQTRKKPPRTIITWG